jgi:sugar lactone lactonase YvrE
VKPDVRTVIDELAFPEGPRWHDGALWFSDVRGHRVVRFEPDGKAETVTELGRDLPSGLGWLPDGRLLIVAMKTQRLLRLEPDGSLALHADLSTVAQGTVNDMIVADDGTAYVGDMGFRIWDPNATRAIGRTILVSPDGDVSCGAGELESPNGHILTPDERTLIIGESTAGRLTAFDRGADGTLHNRRVFAEITPTEGSARAVPDGVCLDADGAVWVADPVGVRVIRVWEGGAVTQSIPFLGVTPVACVLGGAERRTLYVCVAAALQPDASQLRSGRIDAIEVEVAGAGKP